MVPFISIHHGLIVVTVEKVELSLVEGPALFETSTNGREGEHHHGHKRKLSSDKQARDLSPKRACTSNPQEETGGEEVGGARGDKRHKNALCVVESLKDDDIIMSEVELDKDMFQKVLVEIGDHIQECIKSYGDGVMEKDLQQVEQVELILQLDVERLLDLDVELAGPGCVEQVERLLDLDLEQQGYSECIEVIIRFHPGQVENLLQLVCSEKIAENKVLPMMDYLCNSSRQMMTIVLSGLSQKVTTAGMELLSISSNYQDLMPQFLRGIRILSALYPTYIRAIKHSSSLHSLPHHHPINSGGGA
ncbi:hypothetical protein EMCRGX_G020934 [Ephydatia muelleri]